MRFLKRWRSTESPLSDLALIDVAFVVTLLPLLLIIKVPILIYLAVFAGVMYFSKRRAPWTLALLALFGVMMIFFALYGAFNFAGLSRLKLFVEMLIYGLLLAVTLQRLTREINFYLLISPALFLALSLFFFHSIGMLIYVTVAIFILLWLILAHRMQSSPAESLRVAGMMFMMSLPWVVLLFIFFPRISFEHASYGFRGEENYRMGHDGLMHMDDKALSVPSDRIVMEVGFVGKMPANHQLYFRGSVLYIDKKNRWEPLPYARKVGRYINQGRFEQPTAYKVSLYPTHKKWLYLLDTPMEAPEGASIDTHFVTTLKLPIVEPLVYEAGSGLSYRYDRKENVYVRQMALQYDADANPKALQNARMLKADHPDPTDRLNALYAHFKSADLTYTLKPDSMDLNNSTDSFLYETRRGYCVHFAGAFATMARMAGLPARIVTGYKADRKNSVENYLVVKERDAHAWVEVLLGTEWNRIEATATAAHVEDPTQFLRERESFFEGQSEWMKELNLHLLYIKYQVETWILNYSHFRQMQLWDEIKKDPAFLARFVAILALLIAISAALFFYLRKPACRVRALCIIAPVLERLEKAGFVRERSETLHRLFRRYAAKHPDSGIDAVDQAYHTTRYARHSPDDLEALTRATRAFMQRDA